MARTSGRSMWLAVPVGVLCAAVVCALIYLAAPMVPVAAQWVGDTLRASSVEAQQEAATPSPSELLAGETSLDCRDLYPDLLWAELIWHGDVLLGQGQARAPIASPELGDALAPTVRLTCTWRLAGGDSIVTAISSVGADAAAIAEPALRAQGFDCVVSDGALSCTGGSGGTTESHVIRDGLWLASVSTGWAPDAYGSRLAEFVWD